MANDNMPSRMARRKPEKQKHWWKTTFKWLIRLILLAVVAGIALFAWYAKDAPTVTQADLKADGSAVVYDANNKAFTSFGLENRSYVNANQIPQTLKDAVVSIEDRRFYQEKLGIDPLRIVSAAANNVVGKVTGKGTGLQGGSTLTQQLIKLAKFSTNASDQTLKRKAQEAWLAMQVQQKYSKEQILEYYINKVYMNNAQYGMGTAAKYYYSKDLKQLTLPQLAFLAGMPQSPADYDPYAHPQAAQNRRNLVIDAMLRDKKISANQAQAAKDTPITSGLVKKKPATNDSQQDKVTDSYLSEVIAEVRKKLKVNPYTTSLRIYTNLDMNAQKQLYQIVNTNNEVQFPDNKLQTAVTMTDPNTGRVLAQIGGRKTGNVRLGFNRATRNTRSNGSTMKPMLDYGPAIEYLNYSTYQQMVDAPYNYPGSSTRLQDWDNRYQGQMSMRTALVQSRNVPAVKTLVALGMPRALAFLKGLGITLPKDQQYYSAGIGASVTTEQEAAAYGAFANGGTYYHPTYVRKVIEPDGTTVNFETRGSRAMKSSTAYMITDMLKGVFTQGTATAAKVGDLYEAGKTGTTNYSDNELSANPALRAAGTAKDSWFTGYTRNRVISVWTGYDKATEHGLNYAQQRIAQMIYKALMTKAAQGLPNQDWEKPDSVMVEHILKGSNPGTAVSGSTSNTTRELYVRGHGPGARTKAPAADDNDNDADDNADQDNQDSQDESASESSSSQSSSSSASSSAASSSDASSSSAPESSSSASSSAQSSQSQSSSAASSSQTSRRP